jgi:hypothetical protein
VRFFLDQHAELDFYSASSLKQQSVGRQVAPLRHHHILIAITNQSLLFLLNAACLAINDKPTKSLGIKNKAYAAMRIFNIFNFNYLSCDWTVKDD